MAPSTHVRITIPGRSKRAPHVVFDTGPRWLSCEHCGAVQQQPRHRLTPAEVARAVGIFESQHGRCPDPRQPLLIP